MLVEILTEVQEITMTYKGTVKFYNKEKVKFNNFNKMFQRFGRDME